MEKILAILKESDIPFAYDHFAEGESPDPPFICYLFPGSNNFAADGKVYFKANEVHIELYTDFKDLTVDQKHGLKAKSYMKSYIFLKRRFKTYGK
jgi:hypothetical protein